MRIEKWLSIAGPFALTSCGLTPPPPPVPVEGGHEELSAIAGEWTGQYWSKETGRRGVIRFTMPEPADTGYGEVEITFSPALRLGREVSAADGIKGDLGDDLAPSPSTILNIRIVRVEHDLVRGLMEPYWDPDCDCRAHTIFEGRVSENQIAGSFRSRRESEDPRVLTGEWRVDRKR